MEAVSYKIVRLTDKPEIKEQAAQWFHEKWDIPLNAYLESMDECLTEGNPVPQWYVATEDNRIIGGLGVIENDFHDRKDLVPNVCAVYTEEDRRRRGGGRRPITLRMCRHEREGNRYPVSCNGSHRVL